MVSYLGILQKSELFCRLPDNIIACLMEAKSCYIKEYHKGETIYDYQHPITHAGVVLEGMVDIINSSPDGHDTIVKRLMAGESFGLSYALSREVNYFNDIRSKAFSRILFIEIQMLMQEYCIQGDYYRIFMENIFSSLARNNIRMNAKIRILGQKTLREKLLTYFAWLVQERNSQTVIIPFNREELASFLGSERSSVSRELSKLSEEGLIRIEGRKVVLLQKK